MPLYEYQCTACNQRTEVLQRLDEAPLTVCSSCGGPLKKLISSPAFQFKGSGWYITDYARKGGGGEAGSSGGAASGSSGGGGKDGAAGSQPSSSEPGSSTASAKTESSAASAASKPVAKESKPSGS